MARRNHAPHDLIEISPPDISQYRAGNTGVDYVHVLDSGKPGPDVMVQALTHGNEYCGAIALDYLFREGVAPVKGKLTQPSSPPTARKPGARPTTTA